MKGRRKLLALGTSLRFRPFYQILASGSKGKTGLLEVHFRRKWKLGSLSSGVVHAQADKFSCSSFVFGELWSPEAGFNIGAAVAL